MSEDKYKKIVDMLHTNVHFLRTKKGYNPSEMDILTAKMISDFFKDSCNECKEAAERMKYNPPQSQQNQNIISKLFGGQS